MTKDTKEILRSVKKLQIRTRHLVDGLLQGAYHSIFRGRGIEFSEVREYMVGDDVRAIDWNVTARMGRPFIKEFIEERDLTVYIVFDQSPSGSFGSSVEKRRIAVELSASLMFAALRNNDKIGLALFSGGIDRFYPPRKGKRHVLRMISQIITSRPKHNTTDIAQALAFLARVIKKRSIIFIISDFISAPFMHPLRLLRRRNDIIALDITDPNELEIPNIGPVELEDSETGLQLLVDTSDQQFRDEYKRLMENRKTMLKRTLRRCRTDHIQVMAGEPFDRPLREYFHKRAKRR